MATKDEKDKAYANGVKDGKNDNSLGDFVQGLGLGSSSMDKDLRDTYDKGHDFGREHRYDGSQKDSGSKTSNREASSSDSSTRDRGDSDKSYDSYSSNSTHYSNPNSREWHDNWFFKGIGGFFLEILYIAFFLLVASFVIVFFGFLFVILRTLFS